MKLALATLALMASPVAAEVVMMEPPVVVTCGTPASLAALQSCLQQHRLAGTEIGAIAGPAKQPKGARLFAIYSNDPTQHELQSIALYLQDAKGHWHVGGLRELGGLLGEVALTRFERVGSAHPGYRFDLTLVHPSAFSPDDVTTEPTVFREATASLCGGDSYGCTALTESCQMFVHGQVYSGWQGSLEITGDNIVLKGAGTQPSCSQPGAWTLPQLGFRS